MQTILINENLQVQHRQQAACVDTAVLALIDDIWNEATKVNDQLFDGTVLSVQQVNQDLLVTASLPYRYFFAAQQSAHVKAALKLSIAAVSGIVTDGTFCLAGKRADFVTQYTGLWELVPSGSLVAKPEERLIDYKKQLLQELQEEIGINAQNVQTVRPLLLVFDEEAGVYDICCAIITTNSELKRAQAGFRADEYACLQMYEIRDLHKVIETNSSAWVPTSAMILDSMRIC